MNHGFILAYVDEYLSGTIDPHDRIIFEECLASHPNLRAWIDEEKKLKGYMGSLKAPQPDENYWAALENRILLKVTESEIPSESDDITSKIKPIFTIWRYLIPLAAVLAALFWSFSLVPGQTITGRSAATSQTIGDSSQLADITLEAEFMSSAILGPPGAVSRMILLKSLNGKN